MTNLKEDAVPLYTQDQIQAITSRIKHVKFGMLTTQDSSATLTSRPLPCQQVDNQGNMWFLIADDAEFVLDLHEHPGVNISFADPTHQLYLSVAGQAYTLRDPARARELWNPLARGWFSGPDDPRLLLLRVRIESAEYWDATTSRMTQLFAMAKAAFTGTRSGAMARHTTICL
ncbi:pyridoxamine 5'-phosphate oxidase family protein [Oxalobacteraceae bacterium A2-2]